MQSIVRFEGPYAFLANDHPSTFMYLGVRYPTVSHAYYALRARDASQAALYVAGAPVKVAIACGKRLVPREGWQDESEQVMLGLLRAKFDGPFLGPRLLQTGDAVLGDGRNFVGRLLMQVRQEMRDSSESEG